MKAFEWTNPATVNEAVKLLTVSGAGDIDEAPRPIAGGQDLLTTMKDYTSRPARLVNLKHIPGLNRISLNARGLTIGALVTLNELEEHEGVRKSFPGLSEAAHSIATPPSTSRTSRTARSGPSCTAAATDASAKSSDSRSLNFK